MYPATIAVDHRRDELGIVGIVVRRAGHEAIQIGLALACPSRRLIEPGDELQVPLGRQIDDPVVFLPAALVVDRIEVAVPLRFDLVPGEHLPDEREAARRDHVHGTHDLRRIGLLIEEGVDAEWIDIGMGNRLQVRTGVHATAEVGFGIWRDAQRCQQTGQDQEMHGDPDPSPVKQPPHHHTSGESRYFRAP